MVVRMIDIYVYIFRDDFAEGWRYKIWFPSFSIASPTQVVYSSPQEIVKLIIQMSNLFKGKDQNIKINYKFYENYADYVIGSLNKVLG